MKEMKKMSYYVVELSFRNNNPIHRAVCFHRSNGNVELFGSYEGVISKNVKELSFLKVIEEVTSMNQKFDNQFKLPSSVINEDSKGTVVGN